MTYPNTLHKVTPPEQAHQDSPRVASSVLIIDDDPALGFLARQVFEKKAFAVHVATNAEQAMHILNSENIDCILLDLTIPDINGFELCQLIKLSEKGRDIPVIVVSGTFDSSTVEHVFELGAFDFVRKPVNWRILTNRIDFMLAYTRQSAQLDDHKQRMSSLYNCWPD